MTDTGARVAVVDDHEFVRQALCDIIRGVPGGAEPVPFSTGLAVCEEPPGSYEAAVVDLNLPDLPGPIVLRRLARTHPKLTLIAITGCDDADLIRFALEAGAVTCLSKATSTSELRIYLHAALLGAVIIDPHTQQSVAHQSLAPRARAGSSPLTERELQVLELLARGATIRSISETLVIGEATVRTHRNHIYAKLQLRTREDAVRAFRDLIGDPRLQDNYMASR